MIDALVFLKQRVVIADWKKSGGVKQRISPQASCQVSSGKAEGQAAWESGRNFRGPAAGWSLKLGLAG